MTTGCRPELLTQPANVNIDTSVVDPKFASKCMQCQFLARNNTSRGHQQMLEDCEFSIGQLAFTVCDHDLELASVDLNLTELNHLFGTRRHRAGASYDGAESGEQLARIEVGSEAVVGTGFER